MIKRDFQENGRVTDLIQTADIVWLQANFSSGSNPIYLKRTRSADTAYGERPVGVPIHHTADENGICGALGRAPMLTNRWITEVRVDGGNMFEREASSRVKTVRSPL
jgi:hypothetical protein